MIEQGLFKKYFVGRDGFYWWIGQIAEESSWVDNKRGIPSETNKDTPGFGERYKVRIMGYHTAVPSELPDDHLPWATVMYPVTAGGGTAATSETANLRQGMFVFGFFIDGEDGQQPVIMGVLGYNDYTAIMAEVPDAKFVPFNGLNPANGQNVATYARTVKPDAGDVAPVPDVTAQQTPQGQTPPPNNTQKDNTQNDKVIDGITGQSTEKVNAADEASAEETQVDNTVPKPSKCDPIPMGGLANDISNFIKDIEKTRRTVTDYKYAATRGVVNVKNEIEFKKQQVSKLIMGAIKTAMNESMKFAEKTMNDIIKKANAFLQPNESYVASVPFNAIVDNIICILKKVFAAISKYVVGALDDIINKVINAAKCFINNFVSAVLGTINGLISSLLSHFTNMITSFINGAFGIVNTGLSLAQGAFNIILDVLSLLTCTSDKECEAYYVDQWNILTGGNQNTPGINDLIAGVQNVSNQVSNVVYNFSNGINSIPGVLSTFGNTLQSQLNNVFDNSTCNIGPILCGPPSIALFGGSGAGFAANPVIGSNGSIIAVDIISMGRGYGTGSLRAKVVDDCGNGNGGVVIPFLGTNLSGLLGFGSGNRGTSIFDDVLSGRGRRGVLDPYWAGRRAELNLGGAGGGVAAGVVSPVLQGPTFTGLISGPRLNLNVLGDNLIPLSGGAGGIGAGSTDDTQPSNVFENNIPRSVNPSWIQQSFPGNIPGDRVGKQFFTSGGFGDVSGRPGGDGEVGIPNVPSDSDTFGDGSVINYSEVIQGASGREETGTEGLSGTTIDSEPVGGGNTVVTDGTLGVAGMIILDGGSGYLRGPNGDLGGMNRVWATADQTKVQRSDGSYPLPSSPGDFIVLDEGDNVELPVSTRVVTEPLENGTGGGEEIVGGFPHELKRAGQITAPKPEASARESGEYPSKSDGTYPVITHLSSVYIQDPGVGYSASDEVILSPDNGAKAEITVTQLGAIESIRVTQEGEGFKVRPTAYIKSKGGIGAVLAPQLGLNRIEKERLTEPGIADKVIQVQDVVGAY